MRNFSDMSVCQKGNVLLTASAVTLKKKPARVPKHRTKKAFRSIHHWLCMCFGGKERIEADEMRRSMMSIENDRLLNSYPRYRDDNNNNNNNNSNNRHDNCQDEEDEDDDEDDDDTVFGQDENDCYRSDGGRDVWLEYADVAGKGEKAQTQAQVKRPSSRGSGIFKEKISSPKHAARSFLHTVTGRNEGRKIDEESQRMKHAGWI